VAAAGQFSWPPAGSYLAVTGQSLVAAVNALNWQFCAADCGDLAILKECRIGRAFWEVETRSVSI